MGLAEIFEQDGVLTEEVGKISYVDPVLYLAAFGSEGHSSDAAKAWVRDSGGFCQAKKRVLQQLSTGNPGSPTLSKN